MDVTALKAMEDTISFCQSIGITVYLTEVQEQPQKLLTKSSTCATQIVETIDDAVARTQDEK